MRVAPSASNSGHVALAYSRYFCLFAVGTAAIEPV